MTNVGATLRGIAVGVGVSALIAVVTCVVHTMRAWPSEPVAPSDRARVLANGIAEGFYIAFIAAVIAVPIAVIFFARRVR